MKAINPKLIMKVIAINILGLISLLLMIEGCSYLILKQLERIERADNKPMKEDTSEKEQVPATWNFIFDPAVGTVHKKIDYLTSPNSKDSTSNNDLFTYKSYGQKLPNLSIIVLGGSTSDALGTQFSGINGTWPDHFSKMLSKIIRRKVSIINAATGGNTSSQELIRLITLMQYYTPNYVISMNGINEYYFENIAELRDNRNTYAPRMLADALNRPHIVIPYKNKMICSHICLPSSILNYHMQINKLLRKYKKSRQRKEVDIAKFNNNKSKIKTDNILSEEKVNQINRAANIWENNILYMNAISNARGSEYFVFLQPTWGLDMTRKNVLNLTSEKEIEGSIKLLRNNYLERINLLYKIMREKCEKINYCIDLSQNDQLTKNYNFYSDPRHLNSAGNKKLSSEILKSFREITNKDG